MECSSDRTQKGSTGTGTGTGSPRLSFSPPSSSVSSPVAAAAAAVGGPTTITPNSSSPPPPPPVILSPCAACKILRRRCVEKCVLAPYFPPTEPLKFTIAHKVFGASNIIKMLQELDEDQRADAVNSMVYEANARIRDPVYGCAGAICQLQKQISDLQAELAKAKAENLNIQCQNQNLLSSLIYMAGMTTQHHHPHHHHQEFVHDHDHVSDIEQDHDMPCENINTSMFLDDANLYATWEPLWT